MTPKDPFLEGTFWEKSRRPIRSRALLFTPEFPFLGSFGRTGGRQGVGLGTCPRHASGWKRRKGPQPCTFGLSKKITHFLGVNSPASILSKNSGVFLAKIGSKSAKNQLKIG